MQNSDSKQGFYNKKVVDWAQQELTNPIKVDFRYELLDFKLFQLSVCLLPPLIGIVFAIDNAIFWGWSRFVETVLSLSILWAVVLGVGCIFLPTLLHRPFIRYLDASGVTTASGRTFLWEKFDHVNYLKKRVKRTTYNIIELVFLNGKARLPWNLEYIEIYALIERIPAEKRIQKL